MTAQVACESVHDLEDPGGWCRRVLPASERHRVQFYTRLKNLGNQVYFEDGFGTPRFWGEGGVRWLF